MKKKGKSINKLNRNFITSVGLISAFFVTGALAYAINQTLLGNSSSAASWATLTGLGSKTSPKPATSQPSTGVASFGKAPEGSQPITEGWGDSGEETPCQKRCEDQCDKKYNAATDRPAWRGCVNDCMIAAGCKDAPQGSIPQQGAPQGALNCAQYSYTAKNQTKYCPGAQPTACTPLEKVPGCYYTAHCEGTSIVYLAYNNPECK